MGLLGVITPISGVITLLISGMGPHLVRSLKRWSNCFPQSSSHTVREEVGVSLDPQTHTSKQVRFFRGSFHSHLLKRHDIWRMAWKTWLGFDKPDATSRRLSRLSAWMAIWHWRVGGDTFRSCWHKPCKGPQLPRRVAKNSRPGRGTTKSMTPFRSRVSQWCWISSKVLSSSWYSERLLATFSVTAQYNNKWSWYGCFNHLEPERLVYLPTFTIEKQSSMDW